jgi:AcrR family transcriptional regulator/DNA-binding MarR family transcriptional regulator
MSTIERAPSPQTAPGNGTGHNEPEHERVTEIQRARMLAAMAEVCAEHGAANVTVAHVVARSGVSRRTFYEVFEDREACFLAAFDEAAARMLEYVRTADDPRATWAARIRTALQAALSYLDDEPKMARLLVAESLGAGQQALERRSHLLERAIAAVDDGRHHARVGCEPSRLAAEGAIGAVVAVVHARLLAGEDGRLAGLASELMCMIVLPYLGPAAARRELERPVPVRGLGHRPTAANPLETLDMRLTYRTVRVLTVLATQPGSSNRRVADASGIADQGQMSKLLGRLQDRGLIQNASRGAGRGEPNAWALTERGWQVQDALTRQAAIR